MKALAHILLGRIADAHGIRGDVLVHSYAHAPEDVAAYGALSDKAGQRTFALKVVRVTPKGVICRIAGIGDRNAAEALKGTELYVARDKLPAGGDDEFYHADLIGLAAVGEDGAVVGQVVAVHNFGAGDLLEIAIAATSKSEMLPFTDAFVPLVDIATGRVVVRMPTDDADEDGDAREDGEPDDGGPRPAG